MNTTTTAPTLLPPSTFSTYIPSHHHQPESEPEPELSIFDAKNYFNDEQSNPTNKQPPPPTHHHLINLQPPRLSSASSIDSYGGGGRNHPARSFNATPTASSEASWNSKTGLLSNPPGAIHVSIKNCDHDHDDKKKSGSTCKWLFGTSKCLCSGKKSVQVEDNHKLQHQHQHQPPKSPIHHLYNKNKPNWIPHATISTNRIPTTTSTGCATITSTSGSNSTAPFTFPVLKLNPRFPNELLDPPRESLEVFQPSEGSRKSSLDHVQPQPLFSRQNTEFSFPISPSKSRMIVTDLDDVASDASSDLFEIESFSTQTTTTYPIRDSLDESSSFNNNARRLVVGGGGLYCGGGRNVEDEMVISPSVDGFYEPSEASIDWSVTTAEGFDRASVTNFSSVTSQEIEEMMGGGREKVKKGCGGGRAEKRGLLMSCRCEKAVSVGPSPVKCGSEERVNYKCGSSSSSSKPPLARSRSTRLSVT